MTPPDAAFDAPLTAKKLLREARSGALATLMPGSGDPYCSLVNVATDVDGKPLLLLSKLAIHTKNLLADGRASLMLDERRDDDPLQGARITIAGVCAATAEPAAREQYLRRHPGAAMFAGFADFGIYRLGIARAHLVAGFGRIVDLAAGDVLTDVAGAESLAEAQAGAIAHMNADHSDVCRLFATKLLGAADGDWHCAGIDPEGIELQNGRTALRLFFPQRIIAPGPLRAMLKQMADAARAI